MAGFEDQLLPQLLLQQRAFCIHLISISPMLPIVLLSLSPPFFPPSSPTALLIPTSLSGASLSSAWHPIQTGDKCHPEAQVKLLMETCSLHCEVTIFHLISTKCSDNP